MGYDGINGLGSLNQALVSNVLSNASVSHATSATKSSDSSSGDLSSLGSVSISAFSKQINGMYDELKQIENEEEREMALEGLRQVVMDMAGQSDPSKMLDFTLVCRRYVELPPGLRNSSTQGTVCPGEGVLSLRESLLRV